MYDTSNILHIKHLGHGLLFIKIYQILMLSVFPSKINEYKSENIDLKSNMITIEKSASKLPISKKHHIILFIQINLI